MPARPHAHHASVLQVSCYSNHLAACPEGSDGWLMHDTQHTQQDLQHNCNMPIELWQVAECNDWPQGWLLKNC